MCVNALRTRFRKESTTIRRYYRTHILHKERRTQLLKCTVPISRPQDLSHVHDAVYDVVGDRVTAMCIEFDDLIE